MAYHEVWSGGLPKVTVYYSVDRELNTCIEYGKYTRYFLSIRDCITWAVRNGLIKDYEKVVKAAETEADYLERLDDQITDAADAQHRFNLHLADAFRAHVAEDRDLAAVGSL